MSECRLCPRRCGTRPGFCRAGELPRVFRWGPHFGEEPPICGPSGSGCIFFARCTMRCVYCQNSPWSWGGKGEDVTVARLAGIMRELAVDDGCANWNLVSPTPYLPAIREAAEMLRAEGVRLPFVWNSSGYESVETLGTYSDLLDVALFDLRYSTEESALRHSAAPGYVAAARAALKWAWRERGPLDSDEPGRATRGVICRLLVLPGLAAEAVENLAWIAENVSTEIHVAVMSQFTPAFAGKNLPPFDRGVSEEEYSLVTEAAEAFGFEKGWIQGFGASVPSDLLGEQMPPWHGAVGK